MINEKDMVATCICGKCNNMNNGKVKKLREMFSSLFGLNSFVEKGLFRRFKKDNK